ncbi:MAG: ribonuclease HI family protein [Vicinamibacterales bacterium]|jgi:probable phosphoglycerate mutase|nr:ribonuclease HI family protein [Vicinamibacterales bacterium]HJN42642.1 ribonuclease HI family protein [Vicinamibacterales bacterium]|tara:strand:+ start:888 stop:1367 length:480 start_codon:yes stop_codon:yes gene_type:complete
MTPSRVVAYIDGGARGNPGPAGYGVRIETPSGELEQELHAPIGVATNNVAEYRGLIAALTYLVDHGYSDALIRSDSQLLVRQMQGRYRVKHPGLVPLYRQAKTLESRLGRVTFEHVRRTENTEADRLSNVAMDEHERPDTPGNAGSQRTPQPATARHDG